MIATLQIYMEHFDVANGDFGQCKDALGLFPLQSMYVFVTAGAKLDLACRLIP